MTKKEKQVFDSMKEKAVKDYFDLQRADEETKNTPGYLLKLDRLLDIAMVYTDIAVALEKINIEVGA